MYTFTTVKIYIYMINIYDGILFMVVPPHEQKFAEPPGYCTESVYGSAMCAGRAVSTQSPTQEKWNSSTQVLNDTTNRRHSSLLAKSR